MLRLFYKVHKWIGVGVGLILLMWIVTGVLIGGGGSGGRAPVPPDYGRATVSPSVAISVAAAGDSGIAKVQGVSLELLAGRLVYRVSGPRGRTALVDAATGERVEIGESLAREVAAAIAPEAGVQRVVLLRSHDGNYPRGGLPAWRVILDDSRETWIHLSAEGTTTASTGAQRGKATLHDLHTFAALQSLHVGRRAIRVLFVVTSIVSVALVLTGYYLSLPKGWRASRSTPKES